jgi:hypothetical protein
MHLDTVSDFIDVIFPVALTLFFHLEERLFLFMAVFGTDIQDVPSLQPRRPEMTTG